jgi:hypothetical protein
MKKATYKWAILKHLRNNPDKFIPSYDLEKVRLCDVWIGNSGGRRARELAEEGLIDRMEKGKYVYYRAKAPKQIVEYRNHETGELLTKKLIYD